MRDGRTSLRHIIETIGSAQGTAEGLRRLADQLEREHQNMRVLVTVGLPVPRPKYERDPVEPNPGTSARKEWLHKYQSWIPHASYAVPIDTRPPNIDPIDPVELQGLH